MPPRILISAGEPSGDLHAARLVRSLQKRIPEVEFFGFGGEALAREGVELLFRYEDLSVVGIQEALTTVPRFYRMARTLLQEARRRQTHLAILVDFPGFHLHFARHLKRQGIRVVDYIAPQVWAWGFWRIHLLRKHFDTVLVILPFEETLLTRYGMQAHYVGHPLLEGLTKEPEPLPLPEGSPVFAFLPGSRTQEIRRHLPRMTALHRVLARRFPDGVFVYSLLDNRKTSLLEDLPGRTITVEGQAQRCIQSADYVIVASGTASLEAGLLERPATVMYMLSELTWHLARRLSRVRHASLVNLLLGETVYPEYIQRWPVEKVAQEIEMRLQPEIRREIVQKLRRLRTILDPSRKASEEAARYIEALLQAPSETPLHPFAPFPEIV